MTIATYLLIALTIVVFGTLVLAIARGAHEFNDDAVEEIEEAKHKWGKA